MTMLIRHRADLMALHRITSDGEVLLEIETMVRMVSDEIEWLYAEETEDYDGGPDQAA